MAYLVLATPPGLPSQHFAELVGDLTGRRGWRPALEAFGLAVLVKGALAPEVATIRDGLKVEGALVGRIFDRAPDPAGRPRRADLSGLAAADPLAACGALCRHAFGGYVCVLAQNRGAPTVLRDPSGALDAFAWRRGEVHLVGDEIPEGPAAPDGLAVDWGRLGSLLAEPQGALVQPPLHGVLAIDPGACRHGPGLERQTRLWSPAAIVRQAAGGGAEALRAAVDLAVAAERDGAGRVLCEVSGGLDSAIVATSLAAAGHPADLAVNFWRDQAEADERVYAQAVADLAGTPLRAIRRDLLRLEPAAFSMSARAVRPNLAAADLEYDRLMGEAIADAGADVLMTGQGGDVVFYQLGAAQVAADLLAGAPCEGSRLAALGAVARRTRRSVWSLAGEALTRRPGKGSPRLEPEERDFVRAVGDGPRHPWMTDSRGISAAKQVQIEGLASSLVLVTPTRRAEQARVANPLLAQPVVELCLGIAAPILSVGEGERTLARRAFASRLPPSIAARRSKGDITTYFGRSMAASAGFLRDLLLDGRLVAEGFLDRQRLEAALAPEALIWRNSYRSLFLAAGLETWAAHWEGRSGAAAGGPSAPARNEKARA